MVKFKLFYVDLFVGEISTRYPFQPRPGDYLTIFAKDKDNKEKQLRYQIVRNNYHSSGVIFEETRTIGQTVKTENDYLLLQVDPANGEAYAHLQSLLADAAIQQKQPYTISCPVCKQDMMKMHTMKGIETWHCTNCQQGIIQSRDRGIIEVLPIPPGQV